MAHSNNDYINCVKNQNIFNKTFTYNLTDYSFGNLSSSMIIEIFKDGRPFSHFIEKWLSVNFQLLHIEGCKAYDFVDNIYFLKFILLVSKLIVISYSLFFIIIISKKLYSG